ncbi:MAG: glycosyltransferase family 4 protein [Candidatus Puniceispirillales bacterium]
MSMKSLKGNTILQILPNLQQGGVERGTIEMAKAISDAGGTAIVVSGGGAMVAQLQRIGVEHVALPVGTKNPMRWSSIRRKLRQVMVEKKVDLVHVRSRAPAWIVMSAAKALKIPVVTTIHGRFKATNIFKKYYNSVMMKADCIIAISNYVSDLIAKQFPKVIDKITIIHRGVDIDLFNPKSVNAQRTINAAGKLNVEENKKIIMLPARPTLWKGQEAMIAAMAKLTHKDTVLVLVGAGAGRDGFQSKLMALIASHHLQGRVRLAPETNDMPAAMMLADVVVMPSLTPEPFGRVAIEAQAMGRPVVAFDHGGAAESIVPDETGWLAKPVDIDDLAAAVDTALSLKPRARQQFSKRARQHVIDHFTTDLMKSKTLAIYHKLMK